MLLFLGATAVIRVIGIENDSTAIFLMSAGLALSHLLAALLAVSLAARSFPEEFERGTLIPLMAKPVRRGDVVAGKLLACLSFVAAGYALFVALTLAATPMVAGQRVETLVQAVLLQTTGLALLVGMTLALSLYWPPIAAALVGASWYFGAGPAIHLMKGSLAVHHAAWAPWIERALSCLPDATLLSHAESFANCAGPLGNGLFAGLLAYGLAWTGFFVFWAGWKFSRTRL
jgi:ABC-type transport system involved in multi-copper enzyme maturation permease subunit